ncbi:MAG TPA: hypothetical protein VF519_05725 [Mycobacteriales bacterium]
MRDLRNPSTTPRGALLRAALVVVPLAVACGGSTPGAVAPRAAAPSATAPAPARSGAATPTAGTGANAVPPTSGTAVSGGTATAGRTGSTGSTGTGGTGTKPGTRPSGPQAGTQAAALEPLLVTPADLGPTWKYSPPQPDADNQNVPHQFCNGPFKTDAYRTARKQTDVGDEQTWKRIEEEVTRYQPGRAKAAIAEFREQLRTCRSWSQGTPPDNFTATVEDTDEAPRIGEDSVSVRVRYTAGPYVVFTVMTVAIQGDLLIYTSAIANTPGDAMALAKSALPVLARRASFDY